MKPFDKVGFQKRMGSLVRQARTDRGWTQEALSLECGLSQRIISEIESGRKDCYGHTLHRIACALGVTLCVRCNDG